MAHKMPTTHVGCYRPAVLDGGSNPPISTKKCCGPPIGGPFALSLHATENALDTGRFLALLATQTLGVSPLGAAASLRRQLRRIRHSLHVRLANDWLNI